MGERDVKLLSVQCDLWSTFQVYPYLGKRLLISDVPHWLPLRTQIYFVWLMLIISISSRPTSHNSQRSVKLPDFHLFFPPQKQRKIWQPLIYSHMGLAFTQGKYFVCYVAQLFSPLWRTSGTHHLSPLAPLCFHEPRQFALPTWPLGI